MAHFHLHFDQGRNGMKIEKSESEFYTGTFRLAYLFLSSF